MKFSYHCIFISEDALHRTLLHSQPSLGTVSQLECINIATHRRLAALIITEELIDDLVNIIH
ncbi:hypothetical protein E2C01_047237 [Portunus trituberculatus]|uniref:Uncharacterized protein n=1 Tax=Portunus trituberculatus TaxID=210409 RepID=A0A5B7G897_PORTR|nr:hypothetical protein [Portunus trituberculatus]